MALLSPETLLERVEGRLFRELVEGLVHQYPLCCVLQYCSDIYLQQEPKPAAGRGVVFFRTFSLHRAENLFNGLDHVDAADHFVPCNKCSHRFSDLPSH